MIWTFITSEDVDGTLGPNAWGCPTNCPPIAGAVDLLKRHSGYSFGPGEVRCIYCWCGGFIEMTFRHSLGPGAVRCISPRGRRKEVGNPSPPTISERVSVLASLSLTPCCNAWGYPINTPISRSPFGRYVASYAANPSA
jgi:hypothetical protein